jgi:hypothetical protein
MAEWKKVVVSGSDISQLNNDAGYLTNATIAVPNGFSTASFNGTDLLADSTVGTLNFASSSGAGLNISADAGSDTLTFSLNAVPNTSLANSTFNVGAGSGLTDGGSAALGGTSTVNVGAGTHITVNPNDVAVNTTTLTTAISGSIISTISGDVNVDADGDSVIQAGAVEGTMLNTNVADTSTIEVSSNTLSVLKVPNALTAGTGLSSTNGTFDGSGAATFSVDYGSSAGDAVEGNTTITLTQTAGEIDITGTAAQALGGAPSYTIGLADTISGNRTFSGQTITINNDLIVQGTASFQNTTNLQVADQFILLNSGSSGNGPGGIVIEQGTDDIGEALAWSSADSRWGVTGSFDAASTTFDPDAYVNVVVEGTTNDPDTEVVTKYDKKGNMFVGNTGDIWIYV